MSHLRRLPATVTRARALLAVSLLALVAGAMLAGAALAAASAGTPTSSFTGTGTIGSGPSSFTGTGTVGSGGGDDGAAAADDGGSGDDGGGAGAQPAATAGASGVPGMTVSSVRRLQAGLARLGYFHHAVTGFYGPVTTLAVQRFQRAAGLKPDGVWGPLSAAALARRLGRG